YHAFLPLLPESEVRRQIEINEESLQKYFGEAQSVSSATGGSGGWRKKGFFPPELAYDFNLAKIVSEMGYEWTVAAEIAYPSSADSPKKPELDKIYKIKGLGDFKIFFRHKQASVLILSGVTRSVDSFLEELGPTVLPVKAISDRPSWTSRNPCTFRDKKKVRTLTDHSGSPSIAGESVAVDSFYILTVMDAETFGHHRPGLQDLLFDFYNKGGEVLQPVLVSELPGYFSEIEEVEPRASTWSNEEQDFWLDKERKVAAQTPFLLWKDPSNPIHKLQWEFVEFVFDLIQKFPKLPKHPNPLSKEKSWQAARQQLDQALSSDQFWWASAKPWWSLEMIEAGAKQLVRVVESLCMSLASKEVEPKQPFQFSIFNFQFSMQRKNYCQEILKRAYSYYQHILDLAFEWQRTGKIRQAHRKAQGEWKGIPFKERAPAEWYNQVILEFEDEMKKAAQNLEFEKAIKWRDAVIKLNAGTDVYDVLHVVDELQSVRKIPSLKPFLEYRPEEISNFAKKHFSKPT
ncbi:MAG: UvrB/UvrC motif-containing protein, partial [Candidatus Cloacimonetes bacterium]|nr:UvrB/UvrC motif-containing protein [Candidatus Cloacimonadota bacterium]